MENFWPLEVLTSVFTSGVQTLENSSIVTKGLEVFLKFAGTAAGTKWGLPPLMEQFLSWILENLNNSSLMGFINSKVYLRFKMSVWAL